MTEQKNKQQENEKGDWDLVLTPRNNFFSFPFRELWHYKDLMWLFVKRDFVSQYKQTILGPVWHVIQPALTTMMFLLIFGRIARIPTDGIQPILFYMSGITLWNYFSHCLTHTSNTFVTNAGIFGKVYFPRLVLPISVVVSNLIRFGIQFMLLFTAMVYFHFHDYPIAFSINWLFLPILLVLMGGIGLGLGIIISSVTTKYRDFTVLLTFAVQLGLYITPIVYPYSFVKGKSYAWVLTLNPLTPLLESYRYALFGKGTFDLDHLLYSIIFMVVVLLAGFSVFHRVEKTFMDTV